MKERSVIDIERHFADQGHRVFAVLVVENAYMSGDQTAKRVQRQASDLGFDAAFVQFFYDAGTPFTAKSPSRKIITPAENPYERGENHQTDCNCHNVARSTHRWSLCRRANLRWFQNDGHA